MKQFFLERTTYIGLIATLGVVLTAIYSLILTGGKDTYVFSSKFLLQFVGFIILMEALDFFVIEKIWEKKEWKYQTVMAGYLISFLVVSIGFHWFPMEPHIIIASIIMFILIAFVMYQYSILWWKREEKKWNEYIEKMNQQP